MARVELISRHIAFSAECLDYAFAAAEVIVSFTS